jgi:hypothetical protein
MHRRRPVRALAFAALSALAAAGAHAQSLPPEAAKIIPDLRPVGEGRLRWFGFHVYDARLWAEDGRADLANPLVLTIRYARPVAGAAIAERSHEEIVRLGFGTDRERSRWAERMRELFPDVRDGDELAGAYLPGRGARFYVNGRPLGDVPDPSFARAFFSIWLDPRTSAKDLRAQLLGEKR